MSNNSCDGWSNWEAWNVALWLGNDEGLYRLMVEYANRRSCSIRESETSYRDFIAWAGLAGRNTPDGAAYDDEELNDNELTDMILECRAG